MLVAVCHDGRISVLQAALVALTAGYAAHLVSAAVSMVIVELLATLPTAGRGAKHHTGHAQAGFHYGKHCCTCSPLLHMYNMCRAARGASLLFLSFSRSCMYHESSDLVSIWL